MISPLRTVSVFLIVMATAALLLCSARLKAVQAGNYPRLACGTDYFGFSGENGELAVVQTNGANIVGDVITYDLDFPLNGLTPVNGVVLSGQPEDVGNTTGNTLRALGDYAPPHILKTIPPGSNSFSGDCCEEQMVQAPDGSVYHAHWSDVIQKLGVTAGQSEVLQTYPQTDVVGMASDGVNIWISKYSGEQVGTWDPTTNVFTPVFSTPSEAGALAWDTVNGVLWVGMNGGAVIPYNASGQQLGAGFMPFGNIGGNVDGLAFIPTKTSQSISSPK